MLVRSPCKHSRGSWSRSPSPLTTSGTLPQLFLHPAPTDVFLQTQSGRLVKITLSTHDIRYSAPTVPAFHPYWCLTADTVGEVGQDHPLHSRHQVQCPNCSFTPPLLMSSRHSQGGWSRSPSPLTSGTVPQLFLHPTPTDVFLQTQSGRLVKITLSTHGIRGTVP